MNKTPRAFRMESADGERRPVDKVTIEYEPDDAVDSVFATDMRSARRGFSWFWVLFGAIAVFLLLSLGRSAFQLVEELLRDSPWLGGFAVFVGLIGVIAALMLVIREITGITSERRIERIRADAIDVLVIGNEKAAAEVATRVIRLYRGGAASTAMSRVDTLSDVIMAGEDRLIFVERETLASRDAEAKRIVANAAKQVSVVTTLSPRAAIDVLFVAYAAIRMLRRLSRLYGGRPGVWGFFRLLKGAFTHLAVTGGIAVGDSLLQQVFGLGVAAKVSARLGEGVLNGMMTARFGLAAISVCRPLPFIGQQPPRLGEVAGELLKKSPSSKETGV